MLMLSDGFCVSLGSCEGSCDGSRSCPSSDRSPCDHPSASSPDSSRVCHSCASSGSSTGACHKSSQDSPLIDGMELSTKPKHQLCKNPELNRVQLTRN